MFLIVNLRKFDRKIKMENKMLGLASVVNGARGGIPLHRYWWSKAIASALLDLESIKIVYKIVWFVNKYYISLRRRRRSQLTDRLIFIIAQCDKFVVKSTHNKPTK